MEYLYANYQKYGINMDNKTINYLYFRLNISNLERKNTIKYVAFFHLFLSGRPNKIVLENIRINYLGVLTVVIIADSLFAVRLNSRRHFQLISYYYYCLLLL